MTSITRISYTILAGAALLLASCAPKVDRSVVPAPAPAPEIQLGSYDTFNLDNGLKVIVVQNNKLPRVSFQLFVDHGPIAEGSKAGAASLAGGLLKSGTATKSKAEIDETVDFMGASLSTTSSGAFASGLSKHKEDVIELMADVVLRPTFPSEELAKEKRRTISGLTSSKTDPNTISSNITSALNYGDHPYGELVTEKTIEAIDQGDLKAFYNSYFKPNISYLTIVGDITLAEAEYLVDKHFGTWKTGEEVDKPTWPTPQAPRTTEVAVVPLPGAVQSVIDVTFPVELKPGDQDEIAVRVMNNILGGGTFSGRLFQNLREDKAFTYGAYSRLSSDPVIGSFSANTSVRNEVTDSAVVEIMYEVRRMIKEPVPDSTLQFMKNWMTGTFALGLESPQTIARYALNIERYGLPKDYYQRYLSRLNAVTSADLQRAAKRYLKPNNAYITVVGSKEDLEGKLDAFGTVTFYDMYGGPYTERRPAPEGVTITQVLDEYVDAIGGEQALMDVSSYVAVGTLETSGMSMTLTNKVKGNTMMSTKVEMMGMVAMEQVYNGSAGKVSQMGQSIPMDESQLTDSKYEADLLFEKHLGDYGIHAVLLGLEEVEEQDVYVVEYTFPDETTLMDYFSVETGLRVQRSSTDALPGGETITSVVTYKDYIEVDGVKFPKTMTTLAGPQTITIIFDEVKLNVNLKDSEFDVN